MDTDNNDVTELNSKSFLSLPNDIIYRIIGFLPITSVLTLSETSHYLHDLCQSNQVWEFLSRRRFRVRPKNSNSKQSKVAESISWRNLYSTWHQTLRMPISHHSGPTFHAFAKASQHGLCTWITVSSTEDCRLRNGVLRTQIIVQPISNSAIVNIQGIVIKLTNNVFVGNNQQASGISISVGSAQIIGDGTLSDDFANISVDSFVIIAMNITISTAIVEVDALGQLENVSIPIQISNDDCNLTVHFNEKEIWDAYDLLPGGWWARR